MIRISVEQILVECQHCQVCTQTNQIDVPLTAPRARTNAATPEVSSSPVRHGGHELLEVTPELL